MSKLTALTTVLVNDPDDDVKNREVAPGEQFDVEDAAEADRLVDIGAATRSKSDPEAKVAAAEGIGYDELSATELKRLAKARGLDVGKKPTKAELVETLSAGPPAA